MRASQQGEGEDGKRGPPSAEEQTQVIAATVAQIHLGLMGILDTMANVAAFLASASDDVTGSTVVVGGSLLT